MNMMSTLTIMMSRVVLYPGPLSGSGLSRTVDRRCQTWCKGV